MFLQIATIFSLTCFSLTYCVSADSDRVPDCLLQSLTHAHYNTMYSYCHSVFQGKMFLLIATIFSLTCFSLTYCESAETVKVPDYLFQNSRLYGHPGGRQRRSFANHIFGKDIIEPPRGKTNNVVSEQVRHKPGCTST